MMKTHRRMDNYTYYVAETDDSLRKSLEKPTENA